MPSSENLERTTSKLIYLSHYDPGSYMLVWKSILLSSYSAGHHAALFTSMVTIDSTHSLNQEEQSFCFFLLFSSQFLC